MIVYVTVWDDARRVLPWVYRAQCDIAPLVPYRRIRAILDSRMHFTSPSQLFRQTRALVQKSIEYSVFHGAICIAVEYTPYMIARVRWALISMV